MQLNELYNKIIKHISHTVYNAINESYDNILLESYGFNIEYPINEGTISDNIKTTLKLVKKIVIKFIKLAENSSKIKMAKQIVSTFAKKVNNYIKQHDNIEFNSLMVIFAITIMLYGGNTIYLKLVPEIKSVQTEQSIEKTGSVNVLTLNYDDILYQITEYKDEGLTLDEIIDKEVEKVFNNTKNTTNDEKETHVEKNKTDDEVKPITKININPIKTPNNLHLSNKGLEHIKSYEKLLLYPYYATVDELSRGIVTIGYGHVVKPEDGELYKEAQKLKKQHKIYLSANVKLKAPVLINKILADKMFKNDVNIALNRLVNSLDKKDDKGHKVSDAIKKQILSNQNLVDALGSICYNAGELDPNCKFMQSLMKCNIDKKTGKINKGDFNVTFAKLKNTKITLSGKANKGLIRRRSEEYSKFIVPSKNS